ncbi:phosphatidylglycerophosphatase A family protein [Hazenella coriacea]|uniref:Phosphatidylglycerophosphatase A n=1 Tax=Hazenella coriacea TaxID=1179467 RepID=A0A4R3LC82_9BACL|nr:phosphatidylglycerophosphatase A [Hazenella coriacea]TCS96918.1 phosphatidylglycerophosphatase A [Hazenella coriacea]
MEIKRKELSSSDMEVYQTTQEWIKKRGVSLEEIADLTYYLQKDFYTDLTIEECLEHVKQVLKKREVQNAVLTGIQLDILAEKKILSEPLQDMIFRDESLYGIDEVLSVAILNVYGSIGLTNYGYIDRIKPGVLGRLNDQSSGEVHTFLDDIAGAIAAAAASRLAHNRQGED